MAKAKNGDHRGPLDPRGNIGEEPEIGPGGMLPGEPTAPLVTMHLEAIGDMVLCRMGGGSAFYPALVLAERGDERDLLVFHPPTFGGTTCQTFLGRVPPMRTPGQSRGWMLRGPAPVLLARPAA